MTVIPHERRSNRGRDSAIRVKPMTSKGRGRFREIRGIRGGFMGHEFHELTRIKRTWQNSAAGSVIYTDLRLIVAVTRMGWTGGVAVISPAYRSHVSDRP